MHIRAETILITGGCGTLGLAAAEEFLRLGKTVFLFDREVGKARTLKERWASLECIECDLADPADIERKLAPITGSRRSPDVLVNAVGWSPKTDAAGRPLKIETTDVNCWNAVFATNVTSYFYCSKLVIPSMIAKQYGRIINIGSYVARMGGMARNSIVYVASKAALQGLTKALAREVATSGITVNLIQPGRIKTEMNADVSAKDTDEFLKRVALGRLGAPGDIAGALLYLSSNLADYVTGATLDVDGGLYMGS